MESTIKEIRRARRIRRRRLLGPDKGAVQKDITKVKLVSTDELCQQLESCPEGLTIEEARSRLVKFGPNVLPEHKTSPLVRFLAFFWGPIPWMIEVAAVLSLIVQHWADLAIIVIMLVFNAAIGFWQEHQASGAIEALKEQLAVRARVKRSGRWEEIDAADIVPGDVIRIRGGDIVPADVKLGHDGFLSIDQSALTGESLPVEKEAGDVAYSGSIVRRGEMEALVVATGQDSYFGRTAKLVGEAGTTSHFQKAVLAIGNYLIYLSLALAVTLITVQLLRGDSFLSLFQFTLILIVAAIPVAMPAVLSATMAVGAMALAKKKAIVSRLESIEELAGIDVLYSDKTGTLTQNRLSVGDPLLVGAADRHELLLAAALASRAENHDAIDDAVIQALDDEAGLGEYTMGNFLPFDAVNKRTQAEIIGPEGESFMTTKGAPQVILRLCRLETPTAKQVEQDVDEMAARGFRTLGVARRDQGGYWRFLGLIPLFDPPREDSAATIKEAAEHGIRVKMVTGDNVAIACETAGEMGLGVDICTAEEFFPDGIDDKLIESEAERISESDGFAEVFPTHKYGIVKALQHLGHLVGMTGDGVNDAPALRQADVGIAVSGATDAARAAASLVLTAPGLSVIVHAVEEARRIFERMNSYAIYRITETIRIMVFVVFAMVAFNFYPITAVMIILLALLNDLPIMAIATDNTWLDPRPVRWDMRRVLSVSTILGLVGVVETSLLLVVARDWLKLDIVQLQSLIFLKLAVAGHLTLLVARTRRPFFSRPFPSWSLLTAILLTKIAAIGVVALGLFVARVSWTDIGLVFAYCIAWIFVEDWAKLKAYAFLDRHDPRGTAVAPITELDEAHAHAA
jgi:H+-transporting ATPase